MKNDDLNRGFTSRFIINQALGNYHPWQGYGVTDSLSGKEYNLFSIIPPPKISLSCNDLKMRDYIFSNGKDIMPPLLSLQEYSQGITFLLPHQELVPVTKILPSLTADKCLRMLRTLATHVLELLSSGRFLHNLHIESVVEANGKLLLLPTAYLLPGEIMDKLTVGGANPDEEGEPLFRDLRDLGKIFTVFSRYLTPGLSSTCSQLAQALSAVSAETNRDELYRMVGALTSFLEHPSSPLPVLAGREPPWDPPRGPFRKFQQSVQKAHEGVKQLILVKGKNGDGKTAFLNAAAQLLRKDYNLQGEGILSDQNVFQDTEETNSNGTGDYSIFDNHAQDPLVYSYIIERLSKNLQHQKISLMAIDEESPAWFLQTLKEESRDNEVRLVEIELPSPDAIQKKHILGQLLPADREEEILGKIDSDNPLPVMNFILRLFLDPQRSPAPSALRENPILALSPEELSILNFIAVFKFEVPLAILQEVYATDLEEFYSILQKLITLGLVKARSEFSILSHWELCLVFSIRSRSLSRLILEQIPPNRKKQLHRNIAHILKEIPKAPLAYIFYHLANCGENQEAAFKGYEIYQLFLGRKRLSAVNCFNEIFVGQKLDRYLPPETRFKLLLELGNYFSLIGNMEKAETLYRRCREESRKDDKWQNLRSLAVEAIRKECEILEKKSAFLKAKNLLKKTLESHGEHILAKERARLYNDLAWIYYRLGRFDKSWEYCLLVHKLLDKKQHISEMAQSYNLMGAINWNRSKYKEAILCHEKCLSLREEAGDEIGVATSYNNLGLVYRSTGRVRDALTSFQKSMEIKRRNNNLPGLAAAHLNLALTYLDMEEIEQAEKNCRVANKLAKDIGNQQLLAEIWGTLGEIAYLKEDFDQAREYYFQDLQICHKTRALREKAVVFRRLSELSLAEGKLTEAKELLSQARSINQKIGSRLETILLDLLKGRILLGEGKREQGKMILEGTSLELSLLGRKSTAANIATRLGELYLEEGNESLAREYLLRATSLISDNQNVPAAVKNLQLQLDKSSALEPGKIRSDSSRFKALCRMISIIRTIHNPPKLYQTITENARKIMNMERAVLVLQDASRDTFSILASVGDFNGGDILTDKNIIAILDIARQLGYPLDISRTNIPPGKVSDEFLATHPGLICTPLWIQDEVTGFLYLDSHQSDTSISNEDHSFLVGFSQQLALGLERILLSDRIKHVEKSRPAAGPLSIEPRESAAFREIVGQSAAIRNIYKLIEGIKDMDTTVLLTGPSGSGKDLIAKTIHYSGPRRDKPFHSLNCSAFPRDLLESALFGYEKDAFTGATRQKIGHFESAAGGTIFLNEIGDMPLSLQPKLLHILENQRFYRVGGIREIKTNARIITATNKDLPTLVKQGTFREDLYYRINIFPIRIPGLNERREDIKLLCNHFLTTFCRLYGIPRKRISPEAMMLLTDYEWPGNVRELENTINRLMIICKKDTILPEDLPDHIVKHTEMLRAKSLSTFEDVLESLLQSHEFTTSDPILPKIQKSLINKVVETTGDKTKAAKILGISKPTLYSKLKNYEKEKKSS
ncbi:MAG: sigma 54-interacting transcriptional regulator [Candidatus Krumholzibacteriota bacterium]|nr:sigma 54-interacting transcriptional regulator [Candidatus Krumholzibacteriota bacterium]